LCRNQYFGFIKFFSILNLDLTMGNDVSEKKLHYGVRLRVDQLKYLKKVQNPSEWIRKAVDEKRKREEKKKTK